MLNFSGCRSQASAHAGEIDQMIVLVHWLMLVLFVGWGAFFLFVLFRFRQGREPARPTTRAPRASSSKGIEVAVVVVEIVLLVVLRDSGLGDARQGISRPRARRWSSASSASSSRGTSTIPGRTASSAGPTSSWCPPTIRSASIAATRTRRTTSRRSIS